MIHLYIILALAALPMAVMGMYVYEFLLVDSALDAGASFDYTTMTPDFVTNRPYIPFSTRRAGLIHTSNISGTILLVYIIVLGAYWAISDRRRKSSGDDAQSDQHNTD